MTAKFIPTKAERKEVAKLISVGITQDQVAMVIRDGITKPTLEKHFRHELDTAMIIAHGKIGGKIFAGAMAGDRVLLMFYAKTQMGYKETNVFEGNPDAPLDIKMEINFVNPKGDQGQ